MALVQKFLAAIILCLFYANTYSQTQYITAKKGSFEIDRKLNIVIWHTPNIDSTLAAISNTQALNFQEEYKIVRKADSLKQSNKIKLTHNNNTFDLYLSRLPIVSLTIPQKIDNDTKKPSHFTYYYGNQQTEQLCGLEHRGNSSLSYPKKNYDLEFWTDSISKKSVKLKFKNLRNDDDWILDGLFDEPLLLRSYISNKLWKKIHKPHYITSEPKAKSGISSHFVEVFKNNNYLGIYSLTEAVDRKLLKLQKNEKDHILGELFKATSYEDASSFNGAPNFKNIFPHWAGFEMRYPIIDYSSYWNKLHQLVSLVALKDDTQFLTEINKEINLSNCIDYYIFINLLYATDNISKNYYVAKYNNQNPYFFVPWDLDGVLGNNPEGKRLPYTNQILSNKLFDRLVELNPEDFNKKMQLRWSELRKTVLKSTTLLSDIDKIYNRFLSERIYERNQLLWKTEHNLQSNHEYLKEWILKRVDFLDKHFKIN